MCQVSQPAVIDCIDHVGSIVAHKSRSLASKVDVLTRALNSDQLIGNLTSDQASTVLQTY